MPFACYVILYFSSISSIAKNLVFIYNYKKYSIPYIFTFSLFCTFATNVDKIWVYIIISDIVEVPIIKKGDYQLWEKAHDVLVKAYIVIEAPWFNPPKKIEEINNNLTYPLIYVDKTSTIPKALFKLKGTYLDGSDTYFKCTKGLFKYENDDEDKINSLFGCLTYGHIYKKDNHFLYYIDKNKYCEIEKEKIIKWLKSEEICIKNGDFNVIISPLHNPDSTFLKLVLDYGFSHNFRLIHMPVYETNQTELLSKFSYIAKQYEEIAKHNSAAKLNFYFVDNSIVTGKTIERSLSLVRSLISISGIAEIVPAKFSKVFTLINRSRPHTISAYVDNPHTDMNSYLYLHVPNFNTHNNNCPTCNLVKQYESLVKRSSTNCMSNEYHRLVVKHSIKNKYDGERKYNTFAGERFFKDNEIHYGVVNLFDFNQDTKKYNQVKYYNK